mmetsp:Transcript_11511/g.19725  ORF Transcript_11511/g.19725 Transcript_11511/m.19725 type:complete len:533 (+) Transcript_11511:94-1692(+)
MSGQNKGLNIGTNVYTLIGVVMLSSIFSTIMISILLFSLRHEIYKNNASNPMQSIQLQQNPTSSISPTSSKPMSDCVPSNDQLSFIGAPHTFNLQTAQRYAHFVNAATCLRDISEALTEIIQEHFSKVTHVVMLGVPSHPNLGDQLLWAASVNALQRIGKKVIYVCTTLGYRDDSYDPAKARCNVKGAIEERLRSSALRNVQKRKIGFALQPGGNWGSLWAFNHKGRPQMINYLLRSNFTVVQLPQSINYQGSPHIAGQDYDVMFESLNKEQEKRFLLMIREVPGFVFWAGLKQNARQNDTLEGMAMSDRILQAIAAHANISVANMSLPHLETIPSRQINQLYQGRMSVKLAPDNAFSLGLQLAHGTNPKDRVDIGFLLRDDKEGQEHYKVSHVSEMVNRVNQSLTYMVGDWKDAGQTFYSSHAHDYLIGSTMSIPWVLSEMAQSFVSSSRVTVTNRLHGTVVSILLNKPSVIINDRYRKIETTLTAAFGFSESCNFEKLRIRIASNLPEAIEIANQIVADTSMTPSISEWY